MALRMDMEYGKVQKEIRILVNGRIAKQKVMVCICGIMETDMKENGLLASDMETELISSQMEMFILDSTSTESLKATASIHGSMGMFILECF